MGRRGGAPEPPQPQRPALFKKRYIVAGLFFILALVALGAGGTASPFVFLSLGVVTVLSGVLHLGPRVSGVRAVPESILLRSRLFPLSWTSLVEVKFGTTQFARALSSVGNEMIVTATSEKATFYLPVKVIAASAPEADRKVAEKLGPIARSLSARGAYILPLEGKEAASRLNWSLKAVSLALEYRKDGVVSLKSSPFDVLVLSPEGHLVKSAAAYVKGPAKEGEATLPSAGRKLRSQPLVWEALEVLQEKLLAEPADAYTNFLSSVCATQGEALGDRLVNEGQGESATVLVSSMGAVQVELTRPQLRAIVRAYG
jgi:hypothetical protein